MIAQAVVEGEEDAGGGRAPLSPADKGVAVDEAIVACEIVELALEIGEAQIGKVRKAVGRRPHIVYITGFTAYAPRD